MSKMVRISDNINDLLNKLSNETGKSKQSLVEKAVKILTRKSFLEKTNKEFKALQKDTKAREEEQKEIDLWDSTLLDGLENE